MLIHMTSFFSIIREAVELARKAYWVSPTYWLILLGVALLCAFIGPFGTATSFSMAFGLIYWGLLVFFCAPIGSLFIAVVQMTGWPGGPKILGLCILFGLIIAAVVLTLSEVLLGTINQHPGYWIVLFYSFTSSTFILCFMMFIMNRSGVFQQVGRHQFVVPAARMQSKILDRVPKLEHANEVWALSAQDHYVRILTDKGAALTLTRLADAIAECDGVVGVQIHRSHWVALEFIQNPKTLKKDKFVQLPTGETLPVSKSRMKATLEGLGVII